MKKGKKKEVQTAFGWLLPCLHLLGTFLVLQLFPSLKFTHSLFSSLVHSYPSESRVSNSLKGGCVRPLYPLCGVSIRYIIYTICGVCPLYPLCGAWCVIIFEISCVCTLKISTFSINVFIQTHTMYVQQP